MAEAHVRLVRLSKRFAAGSPAVDDVSLEVPKGSFTTLLGPSGCGKTTLLRLIAGLYEADAGDIYLSTRRVNQLPAHRRGTAMVFQEYALFPHMSVEENVGYGLRLAGVKKAEMRRRVSATLRMLSLEGFERRLPGQLSGGQPQRVAIARSLVVDPELLLLDEPLSNLDAKLRLSIREEIHSLQRRLGITTLYVTHDQQEVLGEGGIVPSLVEVLDGAPETPKRGDAGGHEDGYPADDRSSLQPSKQLVRSGKNPRHEHTSITDLALLDRRLGPALSSTLN